MEICSEFSSNGKFERPLAMNFDCGYARVVAKEAYSKFACGAKTNLQSRKLFFEEVFQGLESYKVDIKFWDGYSRRVIKKFRSWPKRFIAEKEKYVKHFSSERWYKLLNTEREKHTLNRCQECPKSHRTLAKLFNECCDSKRRGIHLLFYRL